MAQSSNHGTHVQAHRVALITGASRGLGYTVAEFLARQRWTLILTARHERPLLEAVKRLQATGASISAVPGDVAHDQHRRDLVAAVRRVGRLDFLFNNASELGASPFPALVEYPLDLLRRVLEVNVVAPLALVHACLPTLEASRGLVVNITSDAARGGYPGWGGYGSSKAAFPGQDISDRPLPEVTLPFWAWLEGQDPLRVTGQRFEAQGTVWEVPA